MISQCFLNELSVSIWVWWCTCLTQPKGESSLTVVIFEFYFLLQALYFSILFDLPDALQMDIFSNLYWNSAKLKPSLMN